MSGGGRQERQALHARWAGLFREGFEADSWGQVEEAYEAYEALWNGISKSLKAGGLGLGNEERGVLEKVAGSLLLHLSELKRNKDLGFGLGGMKQLQPVVKELLVNRDVAFPLAMTKNLTAVLKQQYQMSEEGAGDLTSTKSPGGLAEGDKVLRVTIKHIEFKKDMSFIDPEMAVNVVDRSGDVMEAEQTAKPTNKSGTSIAFGTTVVIRTPVNKMDGETAVIFEFRHFKPWKKKTSVRCWAFMELEEFMHHNGSLALELYSKPVDFRRRKSSLSILSVKPLFLQVEVETRRYL